MKPISPLGLPISITFIFWTIVGVVRFFSERVLGVRYQTLESQNGTDQIAAIIPAHNEEKILRPCLHSLKRHLDPRQIYVISDASTDQTAKAAQEEHVCIQSIRTSVGKAKAITYGIHHYRLFERYKFIFILDADTRVEHNFIKRALRLLDDPEISVVFASVAVHWPRHIVPKLKLFFVSYRERLDYILRFFYIYGQTWKHTNIMPVIPGFCTIYRSDVLKQLQIDTPGIIIEDFNLAFQLHKKKLGKIGYDFGLVGWSQNPDNLKDYWNQVRRWNIGFFQTIRKYGVWPSFFWLSLGMFLLEVSINVLFIVLLPIVAVYWALVTRGSAETVSAIPFYHYIQEWYMPYADINFFSLVLFIFLFDYLITVAIGVAHRRPQYIFYGLFFFILHYITSLVLLTAIIPGFLTSSRGHWVSPKRQEVDILT